MSAPVDDINGCTDAHRRLRELVAGLADADMDAPSLLPEWTVGHILTHLARNAEAMCRRIDATARGELIEQYADGARGRDAAIEQGATRGAVEIRDDLLRWTDRLDETFRAIAPDLWVRPVHTVAGGEHPVTLLPFRRWREVEVHLVDLGVGPTPDDWGPEFVERLLPRLVERLPDRTDPRGLAAWLLGRGPAPELGSWA